MSPRNKPTCDMDMRSLRGQVPFVWQKVGGSLKPDKGDQTTLDELRRLRYYGRSFGYLVEWLNAKGARTKNGGRWDRPTIFYIFKRLQESQEKNRLD